MRHRTRAHPAAATLLPRSRAERSSVVRGARPSESGRDVSKARVPNVLVRVDVGDEEALSKLLARLANGRARCRARPPVGGPVKRLSAASMGFERKPLSSVESHPRALWRRLSSLAHEQLAPRRCTCSRARAHAHAALCPCSCAVLVLMRGSLGMRACATRPSRASSKPIHTPRSPTTRPIGVAAHGGGGGRRAWRRGWRRWRRRRWWRKAARGHGRRPRRWWW